MALALTLVVRRVAGLDQASCSVNTCLFGFCMHELTQFCCSIQPDLLLHAHHMLHPAAKLCMLRCTYMHLSACSSDVHAALHLVNAIYIAGA